MGSAGLVRAGVLLLVASLSVCTASETPLHTTEINCDVKTDIELPSVNESYEGVLELVTGIPVGTTLELDSMFFPEHLHYIELIHTAGETSATIRTKKPLDAKVFYETSGKLYYEYKCKGSESFQKRDLQVIDVNESPEFPQEIYNTTISEATEVDSLVLKVTAEDPDGLPEFNTVTYSIVPPSEDFVVNSTGHVFLKKSLNYNVSSKYTFTVVAQDKGGLKDTATVWIHVKDFDNLNPYFSHNTYTAAIPENQDGFFRTILPEPIKAQDGDTGINVAVTYSISSVNPEKYEGHFSMDSSTGILSVQTAFDREEMSSSNVLVSIKAAQTDDPMKTADAVVQVTVEDVDDLPPEFDQESYSVKLLENSPNNTYVFKANVTNADQGGFVGTLKIIPESTPFTIDPKGTVTVKNSAALDREIQSEIKFQIEAIDTDPAKKAVADVVVTLEDENDNSPSFTSDSYNGHVFVNMTVGMLLVQVEADDPDADVNGQIKYSIDVGNQQNHFSINESTGAITLEKIIPLEPHQTEEFLLLVTATDGGAVKRSASVEVQITAIGDTKPQFNQDTYQGTIKEGRKPGTVIVKVDFLANVDASVTLEVDKEHEDIFNISLNGDFSTKKRLDYDEAKHNYTVKIFISDGVDTDEAVVEVQVTDINDNSPVFNSLPGEVSVSESEAFGFSVVAVSATDKDSGFNGEIRYSLTGGEGRFVIDVDSGMVTLAAALDREAKAEYQLQVVAEDQGRPAQSATASLKIKVTDVNDNTPKFSQAEYQVQVPENQSISTTLLTLSATDLDEGDNGRVSYTIVQQSPSSDPAVFELDATSGALQLVGALDYSLVKEYRLVVEASDGGTPTMAANTLVVVKVTDVNNNPPQFDKESYDVNVSENLANGTTILIMKVTDRDEGGFNGTLEVLPESAPFSISSDGIITVKNTAALDRETTETITFQVQATEATPPNHVVTADVTVTLLDENDNSPEFNKNSYEAKLFHNQTVGMVVVKVEADDSDADVNGQIKYSIDFGNQQNYFSIDENTGVITLEKIIPLEPHQTEEFLLLVTATDGGAVKRSASVEVQITAIGDTKPQFNKDTYQGTVEEGREPGTVIVKVDFLANVDASVTLEVDKEHEDIFNISLNGDFSTKKRLDYDEAKHNYTVKIFISDGVDTDEAVVEVQVTDVNDNSPVFNSLPGEVSVSESAEVGFSVVAVSATDKDSGANGEIRYSLTGGEGRFVINVDSGTVTMAAALDREAKAEYQLQVVAEDQGCPARSNTTSLKIKVTDVNDNTPKFTQAEYQVQVPEDQSISTILLTLSATDLDEGDNGRVSYTIVQQSPSSDPAVFELDATSGALQLVGALDYSLVKEYRLVVEASDGGTPTMAANTSVVVKVTDVNNNPPQFDKESYDVNVSENLASGTTILIMKVTDRDEGGFNGTLEVLPESAPFSISSDGIITVKNSAALDRETTETITFQVQATEATPPNHVVTADVTVTLLDENDNSPEFNKNSYEAKLFHNQTVGTVVVKVEADDSDADVNGQIKYSIDFGNQQNYFSIDDNTGVITLENIIPLEPHQTEEFLLLVTATDGGALPRSASVEVQITAIGNTKPQFNKDTYQGTIEEGREPGTVIVKVDFLANVDASVTLEVDKEHEDIFNISLNGDFSTIKKLDYDEAKHNYTVKIFISDGVDTDEAVVEVQVTDVNDNSPIFNSLPGEVSVSESAEVGFSVVTVSATDKDSGANGEIRYSLTGGEGRFVINVDSGMVTLAAAMDREAKAEYQLQVVAEDQGRPAQSATTSLKIKVTDVNDNTPKFTHSEYQVQVPEDQSISTILLTLSATDLDEGDNGRVSYTIVQQSPSSDPAVFELDSTSGALQLVGALDYSLVKEYRLVVEASDGGTPSLAATTSVVAKVTDVNNNPPEFDKESYDVNVSENLASGTTILIMKVTDRDEGGFIGTLEVLPESAPFSISSDGIITVKNAAALDRETTETITFQVQATAATPPNHVVTADVKVTLLDENDNSPEFNKNSYEAKLFSNQTVGTVVVKVEADDPDADVNGQIKYSIDFGNQQNYFSIDDNTGAITLEKIIPLEPHQTEEFLLLVTATDGGALPRSASVEVQITAIGNTKPQFNKDTYQGTIEEGREPGTVIVKVDFLANVDASVTLEVDKEHEDIFNISLNGDFSTIKKLDYDEAKHNYTVKIFISDGVDTDEAVVEVQVTDINDNSPVFNSLPGEVSVSESAEVGFSVVAVSATDKDSGANGEIRYSLTGAEGRFVINVDSGTVTLAAALDREAKAEYQLQVVAEDQGRPAQSATASLKIKVTDVNDNTPKFSQAEYQVQVPENQSISTTLLTLSATDLDEGDNGRVSYTIVQQSPSSDPAVFELDASSGALQLVGALDYSLVKEYRLVVEASDGGTPTMAANTSVVVKVTDVNNNPPEFDKGGYDVNVSENLASGTTILTVKVADRDEGGFIGTLEVLPESAPFSISSDGIITVKNTAALDRETTETITFQVQATEATPPNHVVTADVKVTLLDENDNSPEFNKNSYEAKLFHNQTVGMMVVKVEADDPDADVNGQIKYSIDFGNQQNYFSIDDNTGVITLENIIPLEPHQTEEFLLLVTATDGGALPRSASVEVQITAIGNTKPQFNKDTYQGTIEEGREPGTVIVKVDFLANVDASVTLEVDKEHEDIFNISLNGDFSTIKKLDYDEAKHNYTVKIFISDGVDTDEAVVEVQVTDVNDNSPVFNSLPGEVSVSESAEVGFSVVTVSATDKDSGANGEIRYSLTGAEGRFVINVDSGTVTLAAALDREAKAEYQLQVVAEDQGRTAKSAKASLKIKVTDVNDNTPKFSQAEYQVQVPEDQSISTTLLTLSATDLDEGDNGRVSYTIVHQSPSSDPAVFELNSTSGALQLVGALDYSLVKEYRLVVEASDGGTPSLVGSASVVVKVTDVNNNPPEFDKESYNVNVTENLASGATILTVKVTDRDEGGFSKGHFSYTSDTFEINNQGVVSLRNDATLDRETKDTYTLQVVAVDQPSGGLSATALINISILDYNDNAPQFPSIPGQFEVLEGDYSEERPADIVTIRPTDPDLGPNGEVTLSIFPPNPLFRFREDGTLMAVGSLDREDRDTHELVVTASDKGDPQRQSITTFRVRVVDVNDNRPEFSSSSYFSDILLKDVLPEKEVLTLQATDKDSGINSLITYSFLVGGSPYLSLDSTTGTITLTSHVTNVTEDTKLELTSMAQDHGEPPLNATVTVVIFLRVTIPESVVFLSSFYNFSLFENETAGTTLGKVQATSGSDLYNVSYSLRNHNDLFTVDTTGTLHTKAPLDKEQEWYILEVEAEDSRIPPTSAVAIATVWVRDVNEPPQFSTNQSHASVFSIAPYKTPVITVMASDPDVGDSDRLTYSLTNDSQYFDVEPSSGLVYVVSVADLAGTKATLEVKVSDPKGLEATTTVEVLVNGTAENADVMVISIDQPANKVDEKISDVGSALGSVLGWTIHVLDVRSSGAVDTRSIRATRRTLVSFISMDEEQVVPLEEVAEKLRKNLDPFKSELYEVFGEDVNVDLDLEDPNGGDCSVEPAIIALVVVLVVCMVLLIVSVVLLICLFRKKTSSPRQPKNTSF